MWHKPCRTFHPWSPCTKTRCLLHHVWTTNTFYLEWGHELVITPQGFRWDLVTHLHLNTLRPRQDERHFADDIFTCIFFNENCCILIEFSLKYVRKGPIDNNPALVQIMAWRRPGDKPLSEPMMVSLLTHICVTRPQWVKLNGGKPQSRWR